MHSHSAILKNDSNNEESEQGAASNRKELSCLSVFFGIISLVCFRCFPPILAVDELLRSLGIYNSPYEEAV